VVIRLYPVEIPVATVLLFVPKFVPVHDMTNKLFATSLRPLTHTSLPISELRILVHTEIAPNNHENIRTRNFRLAISEAWENL